MEKNLLEKEWVSKDGLVKTERLKLGRWEGATPSEGAVCSLIISNVQYVGGDLPPGCLLKEGQVEFTLGETDTYTDRLIERAIARMWPEEISRVTVRVEVLRDEPVDLKVTPVVVTITLTIEMLSWKGGGIPSNIEDLLVASSHHRNRGSALFKEGRIRDALHRFSNAARYAIFAGKTDERVMKTYADACNNLALCRLKLNQPEFALQLTDKVLDINKSNAKARMRKAAALLHLKEAEKAVEELNLVLEVEPNNQEAKALKATAMEVVVNQRNDFAILSRKMLNLGSNSSSSKKKQNSVELHSP